VLQSWTRLAALRWTPRHTPSKPVHAAESFAVQIQKNPVSNCNVPVNAMKSNLDLGLPAGDGYVVLDRLQRDDRLSNIPVVVLTARDPQSSELRGLRSGAAAFFQKPADNTVLLAFIRATLSRVPPATPLPC
jgi:CheY-like chemotaxis protein